MGLIWSGKNVLIGITLFNILLLSKVLILIILVFCELYLLPLIFPKFKNELRTAILATKVLIFTFAEPHYFVMHG